jgi:hypothetical protein
LCLVQLHIDNLTSTAQYGKRNLPSFHTNSSLVPIGRLTGVACDIDNPMDHLQILGCEPNTRNCSVEDDKDTLEKDVAIDIEANTAAGLETAVACYEKLACDVVEHGDWTYW